MRKFFEEFKKFISRGNVVDMAVGVAVAGAFTKIVNAFTSGFVTPLISLLSKDAALSEGKIILREAVTHLDEAGNIIVDVPEVALLWGVFVQTIIDFLLIALMLFTVMKAFNTLSARAKEMREDIVEGLTPAAVKEKAEAEAAAAKAKAEAETKKQEVSASGKDKPGKDKKDKKSDKKAKVKVNAPRTGRDAVITSERTDYDRKEGIILFDRNVFVDDEQYQMHADRLFVFLDGTNDLKRIVAIGNVSITNEARTASCSKAVFTKAASKIVMYGDDTTNAKLSDPSQRGGMVEGKKITFWLDAEQVSVEGSTVNLPGGMLKGKDPKKLLEHGK